LAKTVKPWHPEKIKKDPLRRCATPPPQARGRRGSWCCLSHGDEAGEFDSWGEVVVSWGFGGAEGGGEVFFVGVGEDGDDGGALAHLFLELHGGDDVCAGGDSYGEA